jgi:hypothetical protein
MVPSKLKRHFNTKRSHLIGKGTASYSRLFSSQVKKAKSMGKIATIAEKAQVPSYKVAEIGNCQDHAATYNSRNIDFTCLQTNS